MEFIAEPYKHPTTGRTLWRVVARSGNQRRVLSDGHSTQSVAQKQVGEYQTGKRQAPRMASAPSAADTDARRAAYRGMTDATTEAKRQERIVADAWRLLKGEWDPNVNPGQEVVDMAGQLKRFVDGVNGPTDDGGGDMSFADLIASFMGPSGGPSGGGPGGGGAPAENPVDTPEEIDAFVRANYGYLAGYLNAPEVGDILKQAAREGWDKARLQGALSNTSWWKQTAESAREWDALWNMDKASAEVQVTQRLDAIKRQAKMLGLTITGEINLGAFGTYQRDYYLAVASLREGWTPEQLAERIFSEAGFNPETQYGQGQISAQADAVKQLAADYFLNVGDKAANQWAKQLIMGETDLAGIEAVFKDQAKGRYGSLAEMIDRGTKPAQFFDSYRQQIAQLLEIDADQVDLMSNKWLPVVETVGADGQRRPMTLAETADFVRKTPEYDKTDGAMELASRVGELLGSTFGKVG